MITEPQQLKVQRPALRYFGSKWRMAPWIIEHFPEHVCYVEPFGGSSSVLLRKEASKLEVYNDMDSELVTFFKVLRDRGDELQEVLELTPYSIEEYYESFEPADDDLEKARRFMVRMWMGYAAVSGRRTGWKRQSRQWGSSRCTVFEYWNKARDLVNAIERFRNVQIENRCALQVIKSYDELETLFYLDPPYPEATRTRRWRKAYGVEADIDFHIHLLNLVNQVKGSVVISSYPNALYDEQLSSWERVEKKVNTISHGTKATEVLWIKKGNEGK